MQRLPLSELGDDYENTKPNFKHRWNPENYFLYKTIWFSLD